MDGVNQLLARTVSMKKYILDVKWSLAIALALSSLGCAKGLQNTVENSAQISHETQPETKTDNSDLPKARAGATQFVRVKAAGTTTVTLDASSSADPAGKGLTYHWTQIAGQTVALDTPDAPQARFTLTTGSGNQSYVFEVMVQDEKYSSTDRTTVTAIESVAGLSVGIQQHPYVGSAVWGNWFIDNMVGGDNTLYLANNGIVIDISEPRNLKKLASTQARGHIAKYLDKKLYTTSFGSAGVAVTDVSDPTQQKSLGSWSGTGIQLFDVAVNANNMFWVYYEGTIVKFAWFPLTTAYGNVDLVNGAKVLSLGAVSSIKNLVVSGNKAFLALASGVSVIDFGAPNGQTLVGQPLTLPNGAQIEQITVNNGYLYVAGGNVVRIYSASTLSLLATVDTALTARRIAADANFIYVVEGYNDVAIYELSSGFYQPVDRIKRQQPDRLLPLNGVLYIGDSGRGVFAYDTSLLGKVPAAKVFSDDTNQVSAVFPMGNSRLYSTVRTTDTPAGEIRGVRILNLDKDPVTSVAGNDFSRSLAFRDGVVDGAVLPPILFGVQATTTSNYLSAIDFTRVTQPIRSYLVPEGKVDSIKLDGTHLFTKYTNENASPLAGVGYETGIAAYDVSDPDNLSLLAKYSWNQPGFYGALDTYQDKVIEADFSGVRILSLKQSPTLAATLSLKDESASGYNNAIVVDGDSVLIAHDMGYRTYDFSTALNLGSDLATTTVNSGDKIVRMRKLSGGRVLATQDMGNYVILNMQQLDDISLDAGIRLSEPSASVAVVKDTFFYVDTAGVLNSIDIAPPVLTPGFAPSDAQPGARLEYAMTWHDSQDRVEVLCKVSVGSCTVQRDGVNINSAKLIWQLPTDAPSIHFALRAIVGNSHHYNSAVTYLIN